MNRAEYTGASIWPLLIISLLFFTFGFVTNLNGILMPHLKMACQLSDFASAFVPFAFFSAYFLFSLPSGWIIQKVGYKFGIILGLLICAVGAFLFVPAANMLEYRLFLLALSVLACGITLLQVAANPYVSLIGSPEFASSRISLMGVFNSLGGTIAPLVGGIMILNASINENFIKSLPVSEATRILQQEAASVKLPYIFLGIYLLLIISVVYFTSMPTVAKSQQQSVKGDSSFDLLFKHKRLLLGVIAIFMYVGAEVTIADFMIRFAQSLELPNFTNQEGAFYISGYGVSALVGRVIGIFVLPKLRSSKAIYWYAGLAILLLSMAILLGNQVSVWALMLIGFSNSVLWPCIFPLAIKDLGKDTERGSSLLVMAVVGGALIPLLVGGFSDRFGIRWAYLIPLICYVFIFFYGFLEDKKEIAG
jgi:FHS family L-fucose permease-like MFS transporter